ncbi:hypothetical protein GSI_10001 [Ganoderma sinense ZZ0214-1]|uniref:Uncharacterized protein n=1 Tax=Ganoderma sinense ZZ0214-1 TaxID=1077348 RepID=A0A2G8S276_9APHY|nr:hypothetical protein GSI_10001 [Ganoderma sinense ZZ0214-1]
MGKTRVVFVQTKLWPAVRQEMVRHCRTEPSNDNSSSIPEGDTTGRLASKLKSTLCSRCEITRNRLSEVVMNVELSQVLWRKRVIGRGSERCTTPRSSSSG